MSHVSSEKKRGKRIPPCEREAAPIVCCCVPPARPSRSLLMPLRSIASRCRPGSRPGNIMAPSVCMITRAVADHAHSPQTNRHSPNPIAKKNPVLSQGGGAFRPQHREAPQSLDAHTTGHKGTSSMETGENVVKESPRSAGLCPRSTCTRRLADPRGPRQDRSL
jgi:hypothetical protein